MAANWRIRALQPVESFSARMATCRESLGAVLAVTAPLAAEPTAVSESIAEPVAEPVG